MKTYRLRLFGREVASLEIDEPAPPPTAGITGGGTHNFERDLDTGYIPEPEERFGFR